MGGAPYKSAKNGGGFSLNASAFNHKLAPMYVKSDSLPTNMLKYWTTITYNGAKYGPWKFMFWTAHNTLNGKMLP